MRKLLRWLFIGEDMDAPNKPDTLEVRDTIAVLLLKDFIMQGFPLPDMQKQVDLAYGYAELCIARRAAAKGPVMLIYGKPAEEVPTCASCGTIMLPTGSTWRCPNCGESSGQS